MKNCGKLASGGATGQTLEYIFARFRRLSLRKSRSSDSVQKTTLKIIPSYQTTFMTPPPSPDLSVKHTYIIQRIY